MGVKNVRITWNDIERVSYHRATILYSVIYVGFSIIKKIQNQTAAGTKVVLYGIPPFPLKSKKLFGNYHLFQTPFERVQTDDEFARIFKGRKKSTLEGMLKSLDREQANDLKFEIRNSHVNWKSLRRN